MRWVFLIISQGIARELHSRMGCEPQGGYSQLFYTGCLCQDLGSEILQKHIFGVCELQFDIWALRMTAQEKFNAFALIIENEGAKETKF